MPARSFRLSVTVVVFLFLRCSPLDYFVELLGRAVSHHALPMPRLFVWQ